MNESILFFQISWCHIPSIIKCYEFAKENMFVTYGCKCWLKICYNLHSFFCQPGFSLVQQCFLIAQIKLFTNSKGLRNCVQFEDTINKHGMKHDEKALKIFIVFFFNFVLSQFVCNKYIDYIVQCQEWAAAPLTLNLSGHQYFDTIWFVHNFMS